MMRILFLLGLVLLSWESNAMEGDPLLSRNTRRLSTTHTLLPDNSVEYKETIANDQGQIVEIKHKTGIRDFVRASNWRELIDASSFSSAHFIEPKSLGKFKVHGLLDLRLPLGIHISTVQKRLPDGGIERTERFRGIVMNTKTTLVDRLGRETISYGINDPAPASTTPAGPEEDLSEDESAPASTAPAGSGGTGTSTETALDADPLSAGLCWPPYGLPQEAPEAAAGDASQTPTDFRNVVIDLSPFGELSSVPEVTKDSEK